MQGPRVGCPKYCVSQESDAKGEGKKGQHRKKRTASRGRRRGRTTRTDYVSEEKDGWMSGRDDDHPDLPHALPTDLT